MTGLVLVEVRCRACRKLLTEVTSAPAAEEMWASYARVDLCPRHGDGAGRGDVAAWQRRQERAGRDPGRVQTGRWIPWADLRPAVEEARRTSRTQVHRV